VDWLIPVGRVVIENTTPLEAANTLLQSIGALVASSPDGSLYARYVYPTNWDVLSSTTPAYMLGESSDILSTLSGYEYRKGYNSFWVSDSDASYSDSIVWTPDEAGLLTGVAKVTPYPYRSSWVLETTSVYPISIVPLGEISEVFTEVVEIVNGSAQTKETIMSIDNVTWLSVPLGAVSFDPYTTTITTGTSVNYGYGLVNITYTNKSYRFNISAPYPIEAAQLIVKEV